MDVAGQSPGEPPGEDLMTKVQDLIENMINPAVAGHGGFVQLVDVKDNRDRAGPGSGWRGDPPPTRPCSIRCLPKPDIWKRCAYAARTIVNTAVYRLLGRRLPGFLGDIFQSEVSF